MAGGPVGPYPDGWKVGHLAGPQQRGGRTAAPSFLNACPVDPIAEKHSRGAWPWGWRVESLDGSWLDVAETKENEKAFGRPGANRGASALPKLCFVARNW